MPPAAAAPTTAPANSEDDDTPSLTPAQVQQMIVDKAKAIGVPQNIALSLAQHESGFDPDAESPDNGKGRGTAKGVYQLIDATAKGMGVSDAFDPEQNITAGLENLKANYEKFGSWDLAVAAHQAGAGAVAKAGGIPSGGDMNISTRDYVNRVMGGSSDQPAIQPRTSLTDLLAGRGGSSAPLPAGQPQQRMSLTDMLEGAIPSAQADTLDSNGNLTPPAPTVGASDVLRGLNTALGRSMFNTVNGLQAAYADATGDAQAAAEARYARQLSDATPSDDPQFSSKLGGMLYQGAAGAVTAAPALAGTAAATILGTPAAGAAVGAALFGTQAGSEEYGAIRARGGSASQATLGGALDAGIAAGTSYLPMGFLTEKMGQAGMGEFISGLVARDVPSMVAQSIASDMVDTAIANPNKTWSDFTSQLPANVAQAAVSALVFATGASAVHGIASAIHGKPAEVAPPPAPEPRAEDMALVPEGHEEPIAAPNSGAAVEPADAISKAANVDDAIAAYQAAQPNLPEAPAAPAVNMDTVNKTVDAIDAQHPSNDPVAQANELFQTPEWQAHRDAQPEDIRRSLIDYEQAIKSGGLPDDLKSMIASGVMDYANNTPRDGMPEPVNNEAVKEPIVPDSGITAPKPFDPNPVFKGTVQDEIAVSRKAWNKMYGKSGVDPEGKTLEEFALDAQRRALPRAEAESPLMAARIKERIAALEDLAPQFKDPAAEPINPIISKALDETEAEKPQPVAAVPQGAVVYEYPGMYKKGMTERNALNEAARRNRTDPDLIHTAEPVAGLENPYQVVGRERVAAEPDVLHDITSVAPETREQVRSDAISRAISMRQGEDVPPIQRESARLTISRELKNLNDGKITQEQFADRIDDLNLRMLRASEQKAMEPKAPRERGADFIREKLLQAKRRGDISEDAANMAEWFIQKNPSLLDNLGVSIRASKHPGVSGQYEPLRRVATIFKGSDKSTTAVHELLHHMERLIPEDQQLKIRDEYQKQLTEAMKTGTPEMREYLGKIAAGDPKSIKDAHDMLIRGKLPIDAYQFVNPSEFWAVNMTRIMENRYRAGESGIWAQGKQWLAEAVQHIKGALGLRSDAPMLKEMNRLLSKGDGTFVNHSMLQDGPETFNDIAPEKESIYSHIDPRNIVHGYSPYVGVEMQALPKGSFKETAHTAFAPASKGAAKEAAGVFRSNYGEQAYGREQALTKLQKFAKMFDKFAPADNYKFIDDIENNRVIDNPRLNEAAVALRSILDSYRDRVRSLGTGALDNFNVNYFPHIYKDAGKAEAFFKGVLSKRSLEGGKGFLKQRKYDSLADAIKPEDQGGGGLTPITDNPVEMTLLKLREMDRYIYGQKIFAELKLAGLVKFYRPGTAPDGMVKINDKIGNINSPAAEGGMIHRGDYYAPAEAATVINNHLSPGLAGNGFYDAFRGIGNAMNTAQLAFSLYHVGFTTLDAIVSKNALAAMQFKRGDIASGAKNLLMGTLGSPITPFLNLKQGDRLLKAYRGDISDPAMAPLVEALQAAGARQRDDLYRNTTVNAFKQAVRAGRYGEATMAAIPTMLDYMNKPVFEYLVPRQKFGVFFDMAQDAIKQNPNMDMATKRAVFGKIWDSVDNRMGELVYDNVFWNRALKDGLMAITRSVGWNLGTFRELGGGVLDAKDIFKDKSLSPRTAYVLALPFTTAIIGSAIQYLYTGQGPQDLKDCFFPRDGGVELDGKTPTRKSLPSYIKDVAEYGHDIEGFIKYGSDPLHTVKNKLSPSISTINQMLSNEDFYGGAIRSPGDSAVRQADDVSAYLLKQILPFSVRNFQNQPSGGGAGGGVPGYLTSASFYGLSPAPGYITKSAADQESQEVAKDAPALIRKFRESIKENGIQDDTVARMIAAGLTPEQRKLILKNSGGQFHQFKPRAFGST